VRSPLAPLILKEDTWAVFGPFMPCGTHFDFWSFTLALAGVKVGAVCRLEGLTLTPFASAHSRRNAGGNAGALSNIPPGGWPSAERCCYRLNLRSEPLDRTHGNGVHLQASGLASPFPASKC
jgi:hypothetical protein